MGSAFAIVPSSEPDRDGRHYPSAVEVLVKAEGIRESTARQWLKFSFPDSPLARVERMVRALTQATHTLMVDGWLARFARSRMTLEPVGLTEGLCRAAQEADCAEDVAEFDYLVHPSRETWVALRKSIKRNMAYDQERLLAGDAQWGTQ